MPHNSLKLPFLWRLHGGKEYYQCCQFASLWSECPSLPGHCSTTLSCSMGRELNESAIFCIICEHFRVSSDKSLFSFCCIAWHLLLPHLWLDRSIYACFRQWIGKLLYFSKHAQTEKLLKCKKINLCSSSESMQAIQIISILL